MVILSVCVVFVASVILIKRRRFDSFLLLMLTSYAVCQILGIYDFVVKGATFTEESVVNRVIIIVSDFMYLLGHWAYSS